MSHSSFRIISPILFIALLSASGIASADGVILSEQDVAVEVTGPEPAGGGGVNKMLGWDFTPTEDITVVALGYRDRTCSATQYPVCLEGFAQEHEVAIWDSAQTQLTYVVIPVGTSSERVGDFRYVEIPPLTLQAGQTYTLAGLNPSPDDDGASFGANGSITDLTFDPRVTFVSSRYKPFVGGFTFPNAGTHYANPFFGPNFLIQSNAAPVANAGSDQAVAVGQAASISGALSTDDTTPTTQLAYAWSISSQPSGSTAVIDNPSASLASLTPDMPGDYSIELVVTDEQGTSSAPDTALVSAELDPAFVYERLATGFSNYSSFYDADDGIRIYSNNYDYWWAIAISAGSVAAQNNVGTYSYNSTTGDYMRSHNQSIAGLASGAVPDVLVTLNDAIPSTTDAVFGYIYPNGLSSGEVYFYGGGYGELSGYVSGQYKVDPVSRVVTEDNVVTPLPVSGETDPLISAWKLSNYGDEARYYGGTNGSCPRTRTYTNSYGTTYTYCVYHYGVYTVDSGVASKVIDNTEPVPEAPAGSYFNWFRTFASDSNSGRTYFIGHWVEGDDNRYRQGVFELDSFGMISRVIDDEDVDWDRGWFNGLRAHDGEVYIGGGRYKYGYDQGAWWSSSEQGIFRVDSGAIELIASGASSYQYDYSMGQYSSISSSIDTYNFEVLTNALVYSRYNRAYNNLLGSWEYDDLVQWKEDGIERRIAGAGDQILGHTYDWVAKGGYGGRSTEGRTVLLNGLSGEYTSDYDNVEQTYTYTGSRVSDILLARFDTDRDGIGDDLDNCPVRPNPAQADSNSNGIGDACEDSDADGVFDPLDNCPLDPNPAQDNDDSDAYGNACDICPLIADDQSDLDGDGLGDACDDNSDDDTLVDIIDNCPFITNEDQSNLDGDLDGDLCDTDIDGDGILNRVDGRWDGASFTDQSFTASDFFSDHELGGTSHGRVVRRSNLVLLIDDAPDPDQGIEINAVNGTGTARIRQCDFRGREANLDVEQGTVAILTCGSIQVETIANAAYLVLDEEIVISTSPATSVRIVDVGDGAFVVENASETPLPVEMTLGADVFVTVPVGAVGQVSEPHPGQFEIQNREESAAPLEAEVGGVVYVFEPGDVGVPVEIDIKPGSADNTINLGSNGVTTVAILSSTTFDASQVVPDSVTLASAPVRLKGKGQAMATESDINGDGLIDLSVKVETSSFDLEDTAAGAILKGVTYDGVSIIGTDTVRVVPE